MKPQAPAVMSIEQSIYLIRGMRVMLDGDLARLYGVPNKALKRAVRRNLERFPQDFAFKLSREEHQALRRQIGALKRGEHAKYLPYAFTEQGVAMLSSVLRSPRAIRVNIAIMRVFVRIRDMLATHKELAAKLSELERKIAKHDKAIQVLFHAIRDLMKVPEPPKRQIGFQVREKRAVYRVRKSWKGGM